MATERYNPPVVVDLTAWLAKEGVDIPNAKIKIYTAYHIGSKAYVQLEPGRCYYMLGENGWHNLTGYSGALRNYAEPPEMAHARDYWFFNQCNFAARQALKDKLNEQTD